MSLPYELTTLPKNALAIIRYLGGCDNYAAFDHEISEALGLSERGFGKAIRRLVTREYVELQFEGPYGLTERGIAAAEALEAHDAEARHESFEEAPADEIPAAEGTITRRLVAVYPAAFPVGQAAYFFLRVDAPATGDDLAQAPLEMTFRLQADCDVAPAQRDVTVPPDEAAPAVRFAITAPAAGSYTATIEAFQVTALDLIEAGTFEVMLTAADGAASDAFRMKTFALVLRPGA